MNARTGVLLLALATGASCGAGSTQRVRSEGDGDGGGRPRPGPVACGNATCSTAQYCLNQCLCCGVRTERPPSGRSTCEPIPAGCDPRDVCGCPGVNPGHCDAIARTVSAPCA